MMAFNSSRSSSPGSAQHEQWSVEHDWGTTDDWLQDVIHSMRPDPLENLDTSVVSFDLTPRPVSVVDQDNTFLQDHLDHSMNRLKEALSEQLDALLANSPYKKDQKEILQVLHQYPNDISFLSSYCGFVEHLLPDSTPLYSAAIDLLYSRVGFEVEIMKGNLPDETVLESLGNGVLSQMQYLKFHLSNSTFRFLEKDDGEQLHAWQQIMRPILDVLSYHQLHLSIEYTFNNTTDFASILDILEALPRMKHCSLSFIPATSPIWNKRIKQTAREVTLRGRDLAPSESSEFHKYLLLPKELRMLVLSFTDLLPVTEPSPRSLRRLDKSAENNKPKVEAPTWRFIDGYWGDDQSCCHKCTGAMLTYHCCCNFEVCRASTTCVCADDFYSLLAVSRQFRAESLEVLFSSDVCFFSGVAMPLLDNLQRFLDWAPTIVNLHFMKSIELRINLRDVRTWIADERKPFMIKLGDCLTILAEHSGPSTAIALALGSLRSPYDPWPGININDFQTLEADLCQIAESIYLAKHGKCRIYIDWEDEYGARRVERRPKPKEPPSDVADQSQIVWHKSQWLLNSEDFFREYRKCVEYH